MLYIDFFDKGARLHPSQPMLHDGERSWTFSEVQELTCRVANGLMQQGLKPDSVVATYAPNHVMGFVCQYGVVRAGLVWAPINARNSIADNIEALRFLGAEFLFFHSSVAAHLEQIRAAVPSLKGFVCLDGSGPPGTAALQDWLEKYRTPVVYFEKGPDDVVTLPTTSGTTALPKGVMLTNRNWEAFVANYQALMPYEGTPVNLIAAPLTHAAGYFAATLFTLGAKHVILPTPDPLAIMQAIQEHRVTTLFLPPTLIYMMLAHPRVREFDYSSLRYMIYGGAPMSVQKLREATEVFGQVMAQTYGQTEAPVVISFLLPRHHAEALANPKLEKRLASAGREGPLVEVAILDDEGVRLPDGDRGEVSLRGSMVMKGYYKNPQATADVTTNGWHRTGDVGYMEEGFLYLVDRKKDMIISGGFNIYPAEVEQVIWTHPAVQDCAVVGVPDEKWGEAVTAVLELKPGAAVDVEALMQLCKERVGSVKAPKRIEVWPALPRSAVGKVLKREIRRKFWEGLDRAI